jgi:hypothetical protein
MNVPSLSTERLAEIFKTVLQYRRQYAADNEFFKMTDYWRWLRDEGAYCKIKTYTSDESEDFKRKAGVVAFGDNITLVVDHRLMQRADEGCKFCNFMLGHEAAHLMLEHHGRKATIKHYQLFAGTSGMSNLPPNIEELEANFGGVFLQCGVALGNPRWETLQLAHRGYSDVLSVRKAQKIVQLEHFQRELARPKSVHPRVIL